MLMNMKDLLAVANEHNFAVPAFNVSSNMILKGVMHTCEEMQAPVIIAIHPDELSFVEDSFVKAVIEEAHKATVPVCIHLDHGAKFEQVLRAIQDGFTSVMIDGAHLPFEENIAITKKVVEVAHPVNVSVEAELGTIGTADDYGEAGSKKIIYTEVDDAVKFIKETDIDCLAIAIGTAHGPVSYTHLHICVPGCSDCIAGSGDQVRHQFRNIRIGAVSYTHLDVYKRQGLPGFQCGDHFCGS